MSERETENALNGWRKANDRIRAQMVKLDKAEASVESLRKERDRWQFMYEDRGKALDRSAVARLTAEDALEAARAEATKAIGDALEEAAAAIHDLTRPPRGDLYDALKILNKRVAAIRAPRPPEPPKPKRQQLHQNDCAAGAMAHFADDPKCDCGLRDQIDALSEPSPTPPTSPLGTCLIQGRTAHIDDGKCIDWKPEPTPPSEEPR